MHALEYTAFTPSELGIELALHGRRVLRIGPESIATEAVVTRWHS